MSEPSTDRRERQLKIAAVVVGVLALLYGVLVAGQILPPLALILWGFVVYLLWRFVRAHERLAGAVERIADERQTTLTATESGIAGGPSGTAPGPEPAAESDSPDEE